MTEEQVLSQGYQLVRHGNLEAASRYFATLAEEESRSAEAHFNLGKILFKLQRLPETRTAFLRAVDCGPSPEVVRGILEVTNWRMLASPRFFNSSPAFSPDGRQVVFCSGRRDGNGDGQLDAFDRPGIYLVDLETGHERELISDEYYNSSPGFSPDGRTIVFLSARQDTNRDGILDHRDAPAVYQLDLETGWETPLVGSERLPRVPSVSPDGKSVLFCGCSQEMPGDDTRRYSVVSMCDRTTRAVRVVTETPFHHTYPTWHPKGGAVVYSSWRQDTNRDGVIDEQDHSAIFFRDLVTSQERCLADDERGSNAYPACAPDGARVLFLARRSREGGTAPSANAGIYWVSVDGRMERAVVDDVVDNRFPAWSADSQWILFLRSWSGSHRTPRSNVEYQQGKGLYRVSVSGGAVQQIVSDKFFASRFCAPAPQGSKVAYVSWRSRTNRGLYLADTDRLPEPSELRRFIVTNLSDEAVGLY
ncbi:MAG: PD40 domain-containing protein [Elusimicrobia bacterium]|nr:PD40 domain-containing protein [Elusimicrobiota bacterium]